MQGEFGVWPTHWAVRTESGDNKESSLAKLLNDTKC
jgi:hypothetical protein